MAATLPTITKRSLRRAGIEIHEERAAHWIERGHMEMLAYLARHDMFIRWITERERCASSR